MSQNIGEVCIKKTKQQQNSSRSYAMRKLRWEFYHIQYNSVIKYIFQWDEQSEA